MRKSHRSMGLILATGLAVLAVYRCRPPREPQAAREPAPADAVNEETSTPLNLPVRNEPASFPRNTHLPPIKELLVSGPIDLKSFDPSRDLERITDDRVWWESDADKNSPEDDHLVHKAARTPLLRLIEQVCAAGGRLKVHSAYCTAGPHSPHSLHKEGRAVDVTCDEFSLEKLAKLCWAAGFDWVYHECGSKYGEHVHCSVRRYETPPLQPSYADQDAGRGTRDR